MPIRPFLNKKQAEPFSHEMAAFGRGLTGGWSPDAYAHIMQLIDNKKNSDAQWMKYYDQASDEADKGSNIAELLGGLTLGGVTTAFTRNPWVGLGVSGLTGAGYGGPNNRLWGGILGLLLGGTGHLGTHYGGKLAQSLLNRYRSNEPQKALQSYINRIVRLGGNEQNEAVNSPFYTQSDDFTRAFLGGLKSKNRDDYSPALQRELEQLEHVFRRVANRPISVRGQGKTVYPNLDLKSGGDKLRATEYADGLKSIYNTMKNNPTLDDLMGHNPLMQTADEIGDIVRSHDFIEDAFKKSLDDPIKSTSGSFPYVPFTPLQAGMKLIRTVADKYKKYDPNTDKFINAMKMPVSDTRKFLNTEFPDIVDMTPYNEIFRQILSPIPGQYVRTKKDANARREYELYKLLQ